MNQEQTISLQFSIEEVNTILSALGNMPYSQVFGLIQNIQQQASPQVQPPQINEEKKVVKNQKKE